MQHHQRRSHRNVVACHLAPCYVAFLIAAVLAATSTDTVNGETPSAPLDAAPLDAVTVNTVDTLVVCPNAFRGALAPWLAYRAKQGHAVRVIPPRPDSTTLREDIRRVATGGKLKAIILVGDSTASINRNKTTSLHHVPTHHISAKVNIHFGSTPTIATDNWYADLDGDDLPDVAIGRLTADTSEELSAIVDKIIAYETNDDFTAWRRRINVVAGVGGFGILADSIVESTTKWFLTASIPASYRVSMTYGSWRSPYCPVPRQFRAQTCQRLNEGCLFWIYIGHGLPRTLDYVHVPGGHHPVFTAADVDRIACQNGAPIAAFLSCYAGAFDLPEDCLGEELLRRPGGPVAVLASSRVAMPYGLGVFATEMLNECFLSRRPTLGEMLLHAKRKSMQEGSTDVRRRMLDGIAKAISPVEATPADERREHLHLINLLGDPLLRIRQPERVKVKVPRRAVAGQTIDVSIESPFNGNATLELVVRRDRLSFRPQPRTKYAVTAAALSEFDKTYQAANDPRLVTQPIRLSGNSKTSGPQTVQLTIPPEADGNCHVQVYLHNGSSFAMGSANISIRRPVQQ